MPYYSTPLWEASLQILAQFRKRSLTQYLIVAGDGLAEPLLKPINRRFIVLDPTPIPGFPLHSPMGLFQLVTLYDEE